MAGAAGIVGPGTAMAVDDDAGEDEESDAATSEDAGREGDTHDGGSTEQVDNAAIVDAVATPEFKQAVGNTEFKGEDGQITTFDESIQEFPEQGNAYTVLSSGEASDALGDPETFVSTNMNGRSIPNYSPDNFDAFDVAEFRIDFTVPDGAEGVAFDYRFGSEENPEFLDSEFQDFFEAALITPNGATNIARLPDNEPVTVANSNEFSNSPGGSSPNPDPPFPDPPDTTFNAVTELLTAERSVAGYQGEELRLIVRIADSSDGIYDSAAFIDNLRFVGDVDNPFISIQDEFTTWKDNLQAQVEGVVEAEARAQAQIYKEHGSNYTQPLLDGIDYLRGELGEGDIDSTYADILDTVAANDSPIWERYKNFYSELFETLSTGATIESLTQTIFEYLMGTNNNQSNYLYLVTDAGEQLTLDQAVQKRVDELDDYENQFLTDMENGDFEGADIQKITSALRRRSQYFNELRAQAIRNRVELTEPLTVNTGEPFEGNLTRQQLAGDDIQTNGTTPQQITDSGKVAVSAVKSVGQASGYKGGLGVSEGLKSTSGNMEIASVESQYGIGQTAENSWLTEHPRVAATLALQGDPQWAVWLEALEGSSNMLDTSGFNPILTTAAVGVEYMLGWSPGAKLDTLLRNVTVDHDLTTDYTGPNDIVSETGGEVQIESVEVNDVTGKDQFDGTFPPYGKQSGQVTIKNVGDETAQPGPMGPNAVIRAKLEAIGRTVRTNHPVVFTDSIPALEPDESATLEFEYAVPIGQFTDTFEVLLGVQSGADKATATFAAGDIPDFAQSEDVDSGSLPDGESTETKKTIPADTHKATFQLDYTNLDADIHLYDPNGNHVGVNYEQNTFENQINGAEHSGDDEGALGDEWVQIASPENAEYTIKVTVKEVETVIQNSDGGAATPNQGGGDVEFEVEGTEVPDVNGKLAATPETIASTGGTESGQVQVREVSEQGDVSGVTLEAGKLTNDGTEIPAGNISFGTQDFSLAKGATKDVTATVDVPSDVPNGEYTGDLTVSGDSVDSQTSTYTVLVPPFLTLEGGSATLAGGTNSVTIEVGEDSGEAGITGVSLSANALSNGLDGVDEEIPASAISFTPQNFDVSAGDTQQVAVEFDLPENTHAGPYSGDITVEGNGGDVTGTVSVSATVPPLPFFNDNFPRDPDGDGLYEDVRGDKDFNIFDIQALFNNLNNNDLQEFPGAYNFSSASPDDEVTIFDVQALFNKLQDQQQS